MAIALGSTTINKVALGSAEILKAYRGASLIHDRTSEEPLPWHPSTDLTHARAVYDISSLSLLFVERTGGGSTQASVDGLVGTVRDPVSGAHLVAPSDGARPTLRYSSGRYYLEFTSGKMLVSASALSVGTNCGLLIGWRSGSTFAGYDGVGGLNPGSFASGSFHLGDDGGSGLAVWPYALETGDLLASIAANTGYVEDVLKVGTSINRSRNGSSIGNQTSSNNSVEAVVRLGGRVGNTGAGSTSFHLFAMVVTAGYESGERATNSAWLSGRMGG